MSCITCVLQRHRGAIHFWNKKECICSLISFLSLMTKQKEHIWNNLFKLCISSITVAILPSKVAEILFVSKFLNLNLESTLLLFITRHFACHVNAYGINFLFSRRKTSLQSICKCYFVVWSILNYIFGQEAKLVKIHEKYSPDLYLGLGGN